MTTRHFAAASASCWAAVWLCGCIYSGAAMNEPQGFSSSHFRYQMQARQQAAVAQRQRALAVSVEQPPEECYEICEEPSLMDRLRSRF